MNRPVDWTALDMSSDPVPGDPELVARAGRHYSDVTEALHQAATKLYRIADGQAHMVSEAVDAIRENATTVADDVTRVFDRYGETAQAVSGYAPELDDAQFESRRALIQARQAQQDIQDAQRTAAFFAAEIAAAGPGQDITAEQGAYRRAQGAVEEAGADLAAAKRRAHNAITARDNAAQRAMSRINEVVQGVDLNDGWYQNWGKDFLGVVAKWAGRIGAALGAAALFLSWVPFLGLALFAGAFLFSAIGLAATSIRKAHGDATWTDVAVASIGVLASGLGFASVKLMTRSARLAGRAAMEGRAARVASSAGRRSVNMGRVSRSRSAHRTLFLERPAPNSIRSFMSRAGDEAVGGQAIRGIKYAKALKAEFPKGTVGADEVLAQTKKINRYAGGALTANYTGHALTVYGTEEDIRKNAFGSSPSPAKQLNLP